MESSSDAMMAMEESQQKRDVERKSTVKEMWDIGYAYIPLFIFTH